MPDGSKAVDVVCGQRHQIPLALAALIAMGLLLLVSILYVSPGDDAYPIVVIDAVLIVLSLVAFTGTYWYCTRRAMES